MPALYLDCAYGIAGDMFLAALADLGCELSELERLFRRVLALRLELREERRQGLAGRRLCVTLEQEQPLRHLEQIAECIERLDLTASVRERALQAFSRLADVEAAAHGIPRAAVHFHELGAADTLVDIVGAFWALERLGIERVLSSPLPWFRGEIRCAHGVLTLPAPATTALLAGKPVYPTAFTQEMITPTGALLLDQLVDDYVSGPQGRLLSQGLGYGSMETGGGLRAFLFDAQETARTDAAPGEREQVWVLESNLDQLSGEDLGGVFSALLCAGALDAVYLPGVMKKNRPGGVLQVICRPQDLAAVEQAFFRHTLTLGLRRTLVERVVLPRRQTMADTPLGQVRAKCFTLDGREYLVFEYEELTRLAEQTGRTVAELRLLLGRGRCIESARP